MKSVILMFLIYVSICGSHNYYSGIGKLNAGKIECNKFLALDTPNNKISKNVSKTQNGCDIIVAPANDLGGCYIELVTPKKCEVVDLTDDQVYEFAWTTHGSYCETPWIFQIAGTPATPDNTLNWSLTTNVNNGITHYGGIFYINAAALSQLRSSNGVYHFLVSSYYGSHPNSVGFIIKK